MIFLLPETDPVPLMQQRRCQTGFAEPEGPRLHHRARCRWLGKRPIFPGTEGEKGRGHHPASALLWAGMLGWIGLLVFLYRGAAKRCPHCHTRVVAETALCYWCGSDTLPVPLPEFLQRRP